MFQRMNMHDRPEKGKDMLDISNQTEFIKAV